MLTRVLCLFDVYSRFHLQTHCSVSSLERWDGLYLVIESVMDDISVFDTWLICWGIKVCECVHHPFVIESFGEVVPSVSASGFFSVFGSIHGHLGLNHEILKLQGFYQVCVPNVSTVTDANIRDALRGVMKSFATLLKIILSAENGSILLHGLLHFTTNLSS